MKTPTPFLDFDNTEFTCPNCGKEYSDSDDKYLERCNRNKNGCTRIRCECGKDFFMTYNYKGGAVGFGGGNELGIFKIIS